MTQKSNARWDEYSNRLQDMVGIADRVKVQSMEDFGSAKDTIEAAHNDRVEQFPVSRGIPIVDNDDTIAEYVLSSISQDVATMLNQMGYTKFAEYTSEVVATMNARANDIPEVREVFVIMTSQFYASGMTMNVGASAAHTSLTHMVLLWFYHSDKMAAYLDHLYGVVKAYIPEALTPDRIPSRKEGVEVKRFLQIVSIMALYKVSHDDGMNVNTPWEWQRPVIAQNMLQALEDFGEEDLLEYVQHVVEVERAQGKKIFSMVLEKTNIGGDEKIPNIDTDFM